MDINVFRGIILIIMIISFLGLWIWAWNRKRKPAFYDASLLPLEEDQGVIPNSDPDSISNSDYGADGEGTSHVK